MTDANDAVRRPTALGGGAPIEAILLPALSSIATRAEMQPLAHRLAPSLQGRLVDWPGFGTATSRPLSPEALDAFLDNLLIALPNPVIGIAAGHGATYLARASRRHPGRVQRLILIAPTWRGPLPTMTSGRAPGFCRFVRSALDSPIVGPALYRLNLSSPVIGWMMREHVYGDATKVTAALIAAKRQVARRPGGRHGTAAFVSGALDPVSDRGAFLDLFDSPLPPTLLLRPNGAPGRSGAEMDALADSGRVDVAEVDGALAPHEEHPDAVAGKIKDWLDRERR